jgi:hypothetical protein
VHRGGEPLPTIIGWAEWVSLVELGPMLLKAKMDSGARTCALHTFSIDEIGTVKRPRVRFGLHLHRKSTAAITFCEANVVDKRVVRDSGGHEEYRYVISTLLRIGKVLRRVEVTLTDRENMQYRMLIGRNALTGFVIDPTRTILLGKKPIMKKRYKLERPA